MEKTVAQRLEALTNLQAIDSELDRIEKVQGALPEEVADLEDEIIGYETRMQKFNNEITSLEENIASRRNDIKDSEKLIKKYEEQQYNVRNNREYDAITKEIELQTLEIQISEKKIKETYAHIEEVKKQIEATEDKMKERKKDLDSKKEELKSIMTESESDVKKLKEKRTSAEKNIEERLLNSYKKVRENVKNGLAIVSVKRNACGGCFNIVPPQLQADIRDKKKIIVCEHCGRILADVEDVIEEKSEKKPKTRKKTTKKEKVAKK